MTNSTSIRIDEIDEKEYVQSLLMGAFQKDLLQKNEFNRLQEELMDCLQHQIEKYSVEKSNALNEELIQKLYSSILFTIGFYLKSFQDVNRSIQLLNSTPMIELFLCGSEYIKETYNQEVLRLEEIKSKIQNIENDAYQETFGKEFDTFFEQYDMEYGCSDTPIYFDYPLCIELHGKSGIEYADCYLTYTEYEEKFIHLYDSNQIQQLLEGYCGHAKGMSFNIFRLVLTNLMGRLLLQKSGYELNILPSDIDQLQELLGEKGLLELSDTCSFLLKEFLNQLKIAFTREEIAYYQKATKQVCQSISKGTKDNMLSAIFIPIVEQDIKEDVFFYGIPLKKEELEKVIKKIAECNNVVDKVTLLKEKVTSIHDVIDLLGSGFFGDESIEVFQLLSNQELAQCMKQVILDGEQNDCYNNSRSLNWQMEFLLYVNQLEYVRQNEIKKITNEWLNY